MIMEGYEGGQVAIEPNIGLVAFGEDKGELTNDISDKVRQYFKTGFNGIVRLREFSDTVIKLSS